MNNGSKHFALTIKLEPRCRKMYHVIKAETGAKNAGEVFGNLVTAEYERLTKGKREPEQEPEIVPRRTKRVDQLLGRMNSGRSKTRR